jgi:DNA-binding transcriptional MerR regulator
VLEAGCGTALLWRRNLERIDPTWTLTLTDSSPGMLDAARTGLGDRAEYLVADLQELPFEDGSFDVVLANHMLYHVPDRPRAFAEVARVLVPGGSFHASTNGRGFMQELVELVGPRWRFAQHMEDFGLETGRGQLEPFFADVRVEGFENELAVTEVEPVLAYVRSSPSFPAHGDLDDVRAALEEAIGRDGVFRITSRAGLISCRRPRHASVKVPPMDGLKVGEAAARTEWSPRMLRYLERLGLVVPSRTGTGYRLYGLRELNQLRSLRELRSRFGLEISDLVFAARLRREPELRKAVDGWLAGADDLAWVEWEQRKHERLLTAA